ncbi:sigma-70 family RNA polymerase sigma factor [Salinimicrobium sp. MT39]|uniref:Sigma-70 family RNA polymerase sigma factor n=1 Tax=Salinimicrobium profundisediminis TaxID=2994553 RepID=A0A9X3CY28_9FLAO|nr:sigma-70 family RNA polymerase sigma factor [Salinimicrobium profundisediminis]MCX2839072.1 sigma-70 family RNA polymerase sigma factor [Salinimicrobium profundisediminis]
MTKELQFKDLYTAHYSKVIRLCLGYTNGREEKAKDLTQEVFIKIWQNLDKFRSEANISTWIYRITVNTCLQELRKKKVVPLEIDLASHEIISSNNDEIRYKKMYECINKLSADNKTIIFLELEEVPQAEIAEITGYSHQAIRTRIHRIKEQLSKCVTDGGI